MAVPPPGTERYASKLPSYPAAHFSKHASSTQAGSRTHQAAARQWLVKLGLPCQCTQQHHRLQQRIFFQGACSRDAEDTSRHVKACDGNVVVLLAAPPPPAARPPPGPLQQHSTNHRGIQVLWWWFQQQPRLQQRSSSRAAVAAHHTAFTCEASCAVVIAAALHRA